MRAEKSINGVYLEICANSSYSAQIAQQGGASRVELCQDLELGGITPSVGLIRNTMENTNIGVHVLVRPRAGDFVYTEAEYREMEYDIQMCKDLGCSGVVIGILTSDGKVDMYRMEKLIALARPMTVVFHRAFDRCSDPLQSLEDIVTLGCDRLLTSGLENTAWQGRDLLRELVGNAAGRLEIMAGSGVNANNIKEIVQHTGVSAIHSSAKEELLTKMTYHNLAVAGMNEPTFQSSLEQVQLLLKQIKKL